MGLSLHASTIEPMLSGNSLPVTRKGVSICTASRDGLERGEPECSPNLVALNWLITMLAARCEMTYTLASLKMNLHANVGWSAHNTLRSGWVGKVIRMRRDALREKVLHGGTLTISRILEIV